MDGSLDRTASYASHFPMTEHEISFQASEDLSTLAMRCLLRKRSRVLGPVALVLLSPLIFVLALFDLVAAAVFAGASLMLLLLFLLAVQMRRRAVRRFLRTAADHTVRVGISERGLHVGSSLGEATIAWGAIRHVWTCERVVLFVREGWSYVAIPTQALPVEALRFAEERVGAARRR